MNIFFRILNKLKFYNQINWLKTIYINLCYFSFSDALKFPIVIFGSCSLAKLKGNLIIQTPIKTGIVTIGHRFEVFKKENKSAEIFFEGDWIVKGSVQFGYDCKIYIEKNAVFETGQMCTFANNTKIVCSNFIKLGDHVKIGDESQILDTNFHNLFDIKENKVINKKGKIILESYIAIGSRVTVMKNTVLPSYTLVTSNSVLNKDFNSYGENNLFGGIPAKFIKEGLVRDWKSEEKALENFLKVKL